LGEIEHNLDRFIGFAVAQVEGFSGFPEGDDMRNDRSQIYRTIGL
jgi:hypothetical protein